jgi:hypothetical protein
MGLSKNTHGTFLRKAYALPCLKNTFLHDVLAASPDIHDTTPKTQPCPVNVAQLPIHNLLEVHSALLEDPLNVDARGAVSGILSQLKA